jgi:hypothetical protein
VSVAIPLSLGLSYYDLQATLDGMTYSLVIRWNVRAGQWFLDVGNEDETFWYFNGLALGTQFPIGARRADRSPPGAFLLVDTAGADEEPGFDDLGGRHQLYYLSAADLGLTAVVSTAAAAQAAQAAGAWLVGVQGPAGATGSAGARGAQGAAGPMPTILIANFANDWQAAIVFDPAVYRLIVAAVIPTDGQGPITAWVTPTGTGATINASIPFTGAAPYWLSEI